MNSVILIGRLTKDPQTTGVGDENKMTVSKFTLAVDKEGSANKDKADFIRITTFGKQAETCDKYLSKGRQVAVLGRIQTGSYTNKEGETVYTTDVVANRVEFLGSPGGSKKEAEGDSEEVPKSNEDLAEELDTDIPF